MCQIAVETRTRRTKARTEPAWQFLLSKATLHRAHPPPKNLGWSMVLKVLNNTAFRFTVLFRFTVEDCITSLLAFPLWFLAHYHLISPFRTNPDVMAISTAPGHSDCAWDWIWHGLGTHSQRWAGQHFSLHVFALIPVFNVLKRLLSRRIYNRLFTYVPRLESSLSYRKNLCRQTGWSIGVWITDTRGLL
jgi:hypothetical protein